MYQTGLVVGKFCPLHRGHERVLQVAKAASQRLVVISYTSEDYGYSADLRAEWLEEIIGGPNVLIVVLDGEVPKDDAPAIEHRTFCASTLEQLRVPVDAVFSSETYGEGFAMFLSERWGYRVENRQVDPLREEFPISGTDLRADPNLWDHFTSPIVRQHRSQRVLFIGGESTGKTTIASALSAITGYPWVPEYGRQLYAEKNGNLEFEDYSLIGRTQVHLEEAATAKLPRYVFCDTSPLVTKFYSREWEKRVSRELEELAERKYHHVYFCDREQYVDDGTRSGIQFAMLQDSFYLSELSRMNVQYKYLFGTVEERIERVLKDLRITLKD